MNAIGDLDEADPEAGGAIRFRIPTIWLVAGGGWLGRGIQVLAQLATVRILIQSLGPAGYSVFAVLASLTGWLLLSDFSIGISTQNYISERRASASEADDVIVTGAVLSCVSAVFFCFVVLAIGPWLSARLLANFAFLTPAQRTLAFYAVAFPGIGTALGGVAYRIWFAQHRGYLSNLVPAAGTIIGTGAIWMMRGDASASSVAANTAAYYAPLAILPIIALAFILSRSIRHAKINPTLVRPLLKRSSRFWLSGLLAAAVLQVDYIIMAHVLTTRDIVVYSVAAKLFTLILFVYSALLLALWPVCSEAIARHDWHVVRAMIRRYIAFGVAFVLVASVGVAVTNHWIVRILAPGLDTPIPMLVILLLGTYTVIRVWTDTFSTVLQSMNDLTLAVLVAPIQALLSVSLQWLGARWFGLPGLICGLIGCYLLTAVWALPLRSWTQMRRRTMTGSGGRC